ncbi:unnamed protein product [Bursaphelenchus xylophilus]|uniref:(pine wood nematode) hypothetical protein n=1 Tax=Bursaphelenchus xylophilus TaxID=6326 RepID=A0A1I7RTB1_BURXY|nr:unnamed protein product [Bursaphelenchus xylophilus]CAG9122515.1 unnamed protein product [Bursaphelenchus xylophilus]
MSEEEEIVYSPHVAAAMQSLILFTMLVSTGLMVISIVTAYKVRKGNKEIKLKELVEKTVMDLKKERDKLEVKPINY